MATTEQEAAMKVSDVMTTDVETVRPEQQARDAARFMLQANAGSIPVTDASTQAR